MTWTTFKVQVDEGQHATTEVVDAKNAAEARRAVMKQTTGIITRVEKTQ